MKDFYEENGISTTTTAKVSFIDFIVANGYYRDFKVYCSRYPQVKSRKKLAIMFLRSINKYRLASKMVYFRIPTYDRVKGVSAYEN